MTKRGFEIRCWKSGNEEKYELWMVSRVGPWPFRSDIATKLDEFKTRIAAFNAMTKLTTPHYSTIEYYDDRGFGNNFTF